MAHPTPNRDERGSLPLAMVITVFLIVLSTLALSGLTLSVVRASTEQADTTASVASDSGIAVAAQAMRSEGPGLCTAPSVMPPTFQPAPASNAGFRWWVDKSNIAKGQGRVVVEANSGNPKAAASNVTSVGYAWNAAADRWQPTSRKGHETSPYPATPAVTC